MIIYICLLMYCYKNQMLAWPLCLNWISVIGFITTAIHNGRPLAIIEPAHMVVYFSCHRLSLILLIIIACIFYLNDEGLICSLYQTMTENLKIWIFKKSILLQLIVGNIATNYIKFFFFFFHFFKSFE